MNFNELDRPRELKPCKSRYTHYPIIAIDDGYGVTCDGEIVDDLLAYAYDTPHAIWVCFGDSMALLQMFREAWEDEPWFTFSGTGTTLTDPIGPMMVPCKFTSFGFDRKVDGIHYSADRKKSKRHRVMDLANVFQSVSTIEEKYGTGHKAYLDFATDLREWFKEQDLPIPLTLASGAARLLRDARFWPELRGRVPRATNEKMREHLPGNLQLNTAQIGKVYEGVVQLDLKRAYHNAAMTTPVPCPNTLTGKGWFAEPECGRVFTLPGERLYELWTRQPGLVALRATSRIAEFCEYRPDCCEKPFLDTSYDTPTVVYVYTNELEAALKGGLRSLGLVAAWTSDEPDYGLPRYAEFSLEQNDLASPERAHWLKPMLLSAYGLYATKPRDVHRYLPPDGGSQDETIYWGNLQTFRKVTSLKNSTPDIANVLILGVIQSQIRVDMISEANRLDGEGHNVLGIHADALHVLYDSSKVIDVDDRWKLSLFTNLVYGEGSHSWISDESTKLPGLHGYYRQERVKEYRKLVKAHRRKKDPQGARDPDSSWGPRKTLPTWLT